MPEERIDGMIAVAAALSSKVRSDIAKATAIQVKRAQKGGRDADNAIMSPRWGTGWAWRPIGKRSG